MLTTCWPGPSRPPGAMSRPRASAISRVSSRPDTKGSPRGTCPPAWNGCAWTSMRPGRSGLAIANSAQRDHRELASFHLDRGRRLFDQEQDREAMAELRRTVYLSPYEADAHLLMGRIHLRAGRPEDAVDALKISIWS